MGAKRNAFAALGWGVWKVGSKLGWKYAKRKLREPQSQRERTADAAERTADAAERGADAAERGADAAERGADAEK
ncbi:MAG TPA: hypothetical protein VII47_02455 [Actinomycetota bacterium]